MQVGGIRRTDGRKWGIGGIVGDIEISPIARDEVPQKTASTQSGPRQAVVTGVWALGFFAEPGVRTSQRVSPGAELSVLEVTSAGNEQWTHVRLADRREGWLTGVAGEAAVEQGRISQFSYQDTRVFFKVRAEGTERKGFLLHRVAVFDGVGHEGSLDNLAFVDVDYGQLEIQATLIQRIEIDRSQSPPVRLKTSKKEYRGDFGYAQPESGLKYTELLCITDAFVSVGRIFDQIDLRTVDKLLAERY
jgi:hypothetical protein